MKVTCIETMPLVRMLELGQSSMLSEAQREFNRDYAGFDINPPAEWSYYSAGNLISDDGLVIIAAETLSLNDDHTIDEDFAYIYQACADYQFTQFTYLRDGMVTVVYFVK